MIDYYIILHRKTSLIIKIFIVIVLFIILFVVWGINTFYYQSFFHIHSTISNFNSFYYLEVLIPVKEVYQITNQNKIIVDSKEYNYQVYKVESDLVYQDGINYRKLYLKVFYLEEEYLMDGYQIDVKILKENKKIIDYMMKE